jgi:hypothetical protein
MELMLDSGLRRIAWLFGPAPQRHGAKPPGQRRPSIVQNSTSALAGSASASGWAAKMRRGGGVVLVVNTRPR